MNQKEQQSVNIVPRSKGCHHNTHKMVDLTHKLAEANFLSKLENFSDFQFEFSKYDHVGMCIENWQFYIIHPICENILTVSIYTQKSLVGF